MIKKIITIGVILGGLYVLLSLGFWQLDRLAWKNQIMAKMETQKDKNPYTDLLDINDENLDFHRGLVTGQFLYTAPPIFVGPRTNNEESGYHILQPFQTTNGKTIMVNRGWIPADMRDKTINLPQESFVGGYLMKPERSTMTPNNMPDQGLWYWMDMDALRVACQCDALDYVLYKETGVADLLPKPFEGLPMPRNKHSQYAAFWFAMAGLLMILSGISLLRKKKKKA